MDDEIVDQGERELDGVGIDDDIVGGSAAAPALV